MASTLLIETLQKQASLTEAEARETALHFQQKTVRKGDFLLREGEVAHDVFFITQGLVRQYYTTGSGTEHVCTFNLQGQFVTNIESFIQKAPSNTAIDALTTVAYDSISCEALNRLMANRPTVAGFFHTEIEQVAVENANRVRKLLSQSAEEKYVELQENHPDWIQEIPQQYLAQYIGIAPESLSRIRKRLSAAVRRS